MVYYTFHRQTSNYVRFSFAARRRSSTTSCCLATDPASSATLLHEGIPLLYYKVRECPASNTTSSTRCRRCRFPAKICTFWRQPKGHVVGVKTLCGVRAVGNIYLFSLSIVLIITCLLIAEQDYNGS